MSGTRLTGDACNIYFAHTEVLNLKQEVSGLYDLVLATDVTH